LVENQTLKEAHSKKNQRTLWRVRDTRFPKCEAPWRESQLHHFFVLRGELHEAVRLNLPGELGGILAIPPAGDPILLEEVHVAFAGELGGRPFNGEAHDFVFKDALHAGDRLAFAGEQGESCFLVKLRPGAAPPLPLEPPPNLEIRALTPACLFSGGDLASLACDTI